MAKAAAAPSPWRARLRRWLPRVVLAWLALTWGPVLLFRFVDPPTTAFMLERRWEALEKQEAHFTLRQQWVPLEHISPNLRLAVIAAEDQKFPDHFGFDVAAIEDALEDRIEGKSKRGASTLTQQVAKNLFLWPGRSFVRKGLEAYFTVLLELTWPKWRILEVHLNVAEFANGVYGVEAASRLAFGTSAASVGPHEAALLAAVLPSPRTRRITAPSAAVAQRVGWIEEQARRLGPQTLKRVGP